MYVIQAECLVDGRLAGLSEKVSLSEYEPEVLKRLHAMVDMSEARLAFSAC